MQTFGQELKSFSATNNEMRRKSKTNSEREIKLFGIIYLIDMSAQFERKSKGKEIALD